MTILRLNGIAVDCVIGERPDERLRKQRLAIDVELEVEETASVTDELSETVDYAALTEKICERLVESKCKMIERAAKLAAEVCLDERRVRRAKISITKAGAIANLKSAEVIYDERR